MLPFYNRGKVIRKDSITMSSYITKKTSGDTTWFTHDRFGMFIHFGLYAMPARHEWIKNYERLSEEKYDKYFKYFNPDMFDARDLARKAKNAGMKYAVFTTKHHEGFCLFDSQYTDYKVTNTPYGKDIVKEYADAFRAEGLKVGFYYSLLDWHHPEYTLDQFHPRCDDANAAELNSSRDIKKYAQYMRDQVAELLTNYGKIDILWFDFSIAETEAFKKQYPFLKVSKGKDDWESEKLIATARAIQPDIIIDNRADIDQDIYTPEQVQVKDWVRHKKTGELVVWEACHTFSGSWGYHRDEYTWKSPEMLINSLIRTVAYGGNLLMNVGPTARGYIDSRAEKALEAYGEWLKYNGRSIYGCTMAEPEFKAPNGCLFTQSVDEKRLYIHLIEYPFGTVEIPGLAGKIDYAQFLCDGSEVLYTEKDGAAEISEWCTMDDNSVIFKLPTVKPNTLVPVIEVFLK